MNNKQIKLSSNTKSTLTRQLSSHNLSHTLHTQQPHTQTTISYDNISDIIDECHIPKCTSLDSQYRTHYTADSHMASLLARPSQRPRIDDAVDQRRAEAVDSIVSLHAAVDLQSHVTSVYRSLQMFDACVCHSDLDRQSVAVKGLACFCLAMKLEMAAVVCYDSVDRRFDVQGTRQAETQILASLDWRLLKTSAGDWLEACIGCMFDDLTSDYSQVFYYACHILVIKCLYSHSIVKGNDMQDIVIVCVSLCVDVIEDIWNKAGLMRCPRLHDDVVHRFENMANRGLTMERNTKLAILRSRLQFYLVYTFSYLYEAEGMTAVKQMPSFRQYLIDLRFDMT